MQTQTPKTKLGSEAKSAQKQIKDLGIEVQDDFFTIDASVSAYVTKYILVTKRNDERLKKYVTTAKPLVVASIPMLKNFEATNYFKRYDNVILVHKPTPQTIEENGK